MKYCQQCYYRHNIDSKTLIEIDCHASAYSTLASAIYLHLGKSYLYRGVTTYQKELVCVCVCGGNWVSDEEIPRNISIQRLSLHYKSSSNKGHIGNTFTNKKWYAKEKQQKQLLAWQIRCSRVKRSIKTACEHYNPSSNHGLQPKKGETVFTIQLEYAFAGRFEK